VEYLGGGDFSAGCSKVNSFCQKNGYTGTSLGRRFLGNNANGDNYTTSDDCAKILADIYNGSCVNADASTEMLSLLKAQTRTGKIPAGISGTGAAVANKTGELADGSLGYAENDIAIVITGNNDYVIAILSGNLNGGNSEAITRIKGISKAVYDIMTR